MLPEQRPMRAAGSGRLDPGAVAAPTQPGAAAAPTQPGPPFGPLRADRPHA
jgi:hypothetical protein